MALFGIEPSSSTWWTSSHGPWIEGRLIFRRPNGRFSRRVLFSIGGDCDDPKVRGTKQLLVAWVFGTRSGSSAYDEFLVLSTQDI